jgi:RNA polymerase sigma-70 factor (ECF subfamily)
MDPAAERDEYLMARVAAGQAELLELLVRRHASGLLTFLVRMLGDRHRGEELFQEVFLAVWVKRGQYAYPRPFKPWLYAIALNKCRAAFRGHAPLRPLPETDPSGPDDSPAEQLIAGETAELVNRAVTRLPEQQRAVVVLRVWEGLSYERIAEVVGCTEATARSHMHHALAALRRYLRPQIIR